ncbi:MAG: hypothetical protein JST80_12765 [Bdellovibrionales bacterium]|nr:hypothetical protein [Bdellovibrionales bacterium]
MKYSALTFSLLLFLCLDVSTAQAQNQNEIAIDRVVQTSPQQIVQSLIQSGVPSLGQYDLSEMQSKLSLTRYYVQSESFSRKEPVSIIVYGKNDELRLDARYLSNQEKVYFPQSNLPAAPSHDPAWLALTLHESLGASGYMDQAYGFSTALMLIYSQKDSSQRQSTERMLSPVFKPYNSPHLSFYMDPGEYHHLDEINRALADGGSTGVGHGGDSDEIFLKLSVLADLDLLLRMLPDSFTPRMPLDPEKLSRAILIGTSVRFTDETAEFYVNDSGVIKVSRGYWDHIKMDRPAVLAFESKMLLQLIHILTSEGFSSVYR